MAKLTHRLLNHYYVVQCFLDGEKKAGSTFLGVNSITRRIQLPAFCSRWCRRMDTTREELSPPGRSNATT